MITTQTSNSNPETIQVPMFNFSVYEPGTTYVNNGTRVDFVTYNDELYVCTALSVEAGTPYPDNGFLKIVGKGKDGARGATGKTGATGHAPRITASINRFNQMVIYADGDIIGTTGDLTGPAGVPERVGDEIVWNRSKDGEQPQSIDLDTLRIKEKPLLLRVDSDNTKRSDEISGPANMIQWKYEGDPNGTNLISISELMNLALCGICVGKNDDDGLYHLGHREVIKAKYESTKTGQKIISHVQLGEVLFDAGEIVPDLGFDFDAIKARLDAIEDALQHDDVVIPTNVSAFVNDVPYLTETKAARDFQPKGNYVKTVKVNDNIYTPDVSTGLVDLGSISGGSADTSDCVKSVTINGETKLPINGNVAFTISVGGTSLFDVRLNQNRYLQKTVDGTNGITILDLNDIQGDTSDGLTEAQVKSLIEQTLAGLLDPLNEYNNGKVGHNYFVRFSDLSDFVTAAGIEARYYDKETINSMLNGGGTVTHETLRTFMLFQRNNTPNGGTPPSVPTNNTFVGDGESLYLTDAFANTNPSPWKNSPENVDAANGKVYLGMTLAEYSSTRGILHENNASGWSAPVCLTGENGDGEDGDGIEFIYHLGASQPELNVKKAYKSGQTTKSFTTNANANTWGATKESNDGLPGDGTTSGHWTDNPTGITDDNDNTKTEGAAVRTYNGATETWNSFSTPFIGSKWGEDGVDGDGIEYIYYVTPENGQTTYYNINSSTHKYELIDIGEMVYPPTTAQQIASIANYQTSDGYPGNAQSGTAWDRNGTDNPIGVSSDRPYEGVSVRKRVYDPLTETSSGTPFSTPSLGAKFGKDGIAKNIYTSYIFTRTDQRIGTFVLSDDIDPEDIKTYENQTAKENDQEYTFGNGQHIVWSDTIPSGSGQVGISMNIINDDTYDQGGTSPTQLGDDDYFQVEYCASESIAKALPSLANGTYTGSQYPHGVNEEGLRAYMSTTYNEIWGDEDDIQEPVWMATASKRDGVGTNWAYARIKGEQGEAGTSVRIKATVEYASDLSAFKPAAGNQNSASVGDCYIVIKGTLNPSTSAFGQVTAVNYTSSHIGSYGGTDNNTSDDTNVHMYGFDDLGEFANVTPNNIYMRFARLATDAEQGTTTLNIAQVPVVIGGSTVSKGLTMLSSNQSGPFIGFYIGESESSDIQDYTWSKGDGEDYYGQEQIFLKLEESLTPVRPTYNLNGVTGNRTKISGFTTHQNGSEVTINSVNETTDKANYKRFDYVPIVKVYTNNTLTRTETGVDTPEEIHDNTTTKYNCWQCTRNIGAGVYEGSNPIIYIPYVENGTDGKDGMFEESVYARNDSTTTPPLFSKKYALKRAEGNSAASVVNATSVSGNAASGVFEVYDVLPFVFNDSNNSTPSTSTATGTDNPAGVDEIAGHKVEWVSTRKITYEDPENPHVPTFGPFSEPRIGSHFGENGRDGDGIEYVFGGLTEQENSQITYTGPTQQASNAQNGGYNVIDPSDPRLDHQNPRRSITESEYLPAIIINGQEKEAVDDNPGIENYRYVYASKRKYNGEMKTWGEFSEIKLGNEQNTTVPDVITLDIQDDSHTIRVDEDGRILDRYMNYSGYSTSGMYLYKNTVLMNCGKVAIEANGGTNVIIAQLNSDPGRTNTYEIVNNSATITRNGVTATVSANYAGKYEDSLHSNVELKVVFSKVNGENPILTEPFDIVIKVGDSSEEYVGSDVLKLVPRNTDDELTLLKVPGTQRTSEEGGKTYSDNEFYFYGYYGSIYTTLDLVAKTRYGFKYDNQASGTTFQVPTDNAAYLNLKDHVDGVTEGSCTFYFARNGSFLSTNDSTGAFYMIWLYNSDVADNNHGVGTNGSSQGCVLPSAFTATESYPINELYFGIGFGSELLDEANVHIIYPGRNGLPGENGSYKKELYSLGDENNAATAFLPAGSTSPGVPISTLTTAGGQTTKPSVTSTYPHIGMTRADVTIGEEATQACIGETPSLITPINGTTTTVITYQYLDGTIMRTSIGSDGITNTTKYWDGDTRVLTVNGVENESSNDDGIKYLDVVSVTNGTKTNWYKCIQNHAKRSTNPAEDSAYWSEFAIMGDAAFYNLLVQNAAYIESLTSKQVVITDNNTVVAGMTSGTVTGTELEGSNPGTVRIWAGQTAGNIQTAPFRVNADGSLFASNATISGNITANHISVTDGNNSASIQIVFANEAALSNPSANTLYFIY